MVGGTDASTSTSIMAATISLLVYSMVKHLHHHDSVENPYAVLLALLEN